MGIDGDSGFGLMYNDDGDMSATDMDPQQSVANLQEMVQALADTPVKTLMYSIGAGSDILLYPTEVGSTWGWRELSPKYERLTERVAWHKVAAEAGVDSPRVAGEAALALGMRFVPSYRMNDAHYVADPENSPLTGRFWVEHPDYGIGESPIEGHDYRHSLDFHRPEVRAYRLGIVMEAIERYQDIMAGFELDFVRFQVFFAKGKAQEGAPLITEMVRAVRKRLDELGERNGLHYTVFARIPPAPRNCDWAGLEVERWLEEGLVDVLLPSQVMTLAHDMPVDAFVEMAKPHGVKVCPSLYPRCNWTWPFVPGDTPALEGPADRTTSAAMVRGARANYDGMGADGYQMFNYKLPYADWMLAHMQALAEPASDMDREFAITPGYFLDHEDSYQYRKQLPAPLPPEETLTLTLPVGDDPDALAAKKPAYVGLRLGFEGPLDNTARMTIAINGVPLHEGPLNRLAVSPRSGAEAGSPASRRGSPDAYLQCTLDGLRALEQGANSLCVTLHTHADNVQLVETRLGVFGLGDG